MEERMILIMMLISAFSATALTAIYAAENNRSAAFPLGILAAWSIIEIAKELLK